MKLLLITALILGFHSLSQADDLQQTWGLNQVSYIKATLIGKPNPMNEEARLVSYVTELENKIALLLVSPLVVSQIKENQALN